MSPTQSKSANAGVHNAIGIEFQKHCAVYILLDTYSTIKDKNYFICLEHHDDFLFCHLTPTDIVSNIQAFQAKKSSNPWATTKLYELIKGIAETGVNLANDPISKEAAYDHTLQFLSNNTINLDDGKKKNKKLVVVSDSNSPVQFTILDAGIKKKIIEGITKELTLSADELAQLDKFSLAFIDLPRKSENQVAALIGKFASLFGNTVADHKAAIKVLIDLFRSVETVLNNGTKIQLLDTSKRVTSKQITHAIDVITSKQKAYALWRDVNKEVAPQLQISVFDQEQFMLQVNNSFDLFKDLKQAEHQKVIAYARGNRAIWQNCYTESDCIQEIYKSFLKTERSNLNALDLKAAIFAAYVEVKG